MGMFRDLFENYLRVVAAVFTLAIAFLIYSLISMTVTNISHAFNDTNSLPDAYIK